MKWRFGLLLAVGCIGLHAAVWATPNQITYQGTLKENGVPQNGSHNMQFDFVDSGNTTIPGTTQIQISNVQITNGLFSVQLPLPTGVDWSIYTPFLRISVDGQALTPPQSISSNLYSIASQIPSGSIMAFAGTVVPAGWLLCDGSAVNRTTYATLFAAIGTAWGAGSGSTFNLPDLRGRAPIGAGQGTGLTKRLLGDTTGYETHTLNINEIPSHSHGITNLPPNIIMSTTNGAKAPLGWGIHGIGTVDGYVVPGKMVNLSDVDPTTTNINTQTEGGNATHSIMQPSAVVNFIIKD